MSDAATTEQVEPIPPRYWWLKRLALAGGGLLIGVVALRIGWGLEADRRLRAEAERSRAAGYPVDAAEYDRILDAVPKSENAAVLLEEAIDAMVETSASGESFIQLADERDTIKEENFAAAVELVDSNARAFELVRRARARPAVAWSDRLEGLHRRPGPSMARGPRHLAKLLSFAAYYQFETGDHAAAIDTMQDVAFMGGALSSHPTWVATTIAESIHDSNVDLIERVGGRLQVSGGPNALSDRTTAASPAQIRELIETLLDERATRANATRSYYGAHACELEAPLMAKDTAVPEEPAVRLLVRPVYVLDTVRTMAGLRLAAEAVAGVDWPSSAALFPHEQGPLPLLRFLTRPFTDRSGPSILQLLRWQAQRFFEHLARRRMAAAALAMRVYEIDHGHRPEALEELMPRYLPYVPADPFAPDGECIRYLPIPGLAVLYSVGPDGLDQGARILWVVEFNGRPYYGYDDAVFRLDGQ
jgi:hypothetical protein